MAGAASTHAPGPGEDKGEGLPRAGQGGQSPVCGLSSPVVPALTPPCVPSQGRAAQRELRPGWGVGEGVPGLPQLRPDPQLGSALEPLRHQRGPKYPWPLVTGELGCFCRKVDASLRKSFLPGCVSTSTVTAMAGLETGLLGGPL